MNEEIKEKTVILPPFKHFIMTVGAIPSSYLESMTYYEMLVWFTNYLGKTVIPAINENGEAVTELQNLFRELQDYVNNYFDNLDVQEEINNKLDEMVEEGTLQEIIASYLNSRALFGFDNISDMKNATNLINGSYAKTLGYYTKNDSGSATYKIRTITNDDVVDNMFILEMTNDNTLVAELIIDNPLKVEQIGAYGDAIHDDTTKIQAAIDKCNNILMEKEYNVTEIEIKSGDKTITFNKINGKITVNADEKLIQFLNIKGNKLYNTSGIGLSLKTIASYGIQYCNFSIGLIRATECIKFDASEGGWINQNYFHNTNVSYGTGITSVTLPSSRSYNGNVFSEFGFEDITKWFNLYSFEEDLFEKCRMIPFEADGQGTDVRELGILNDCKKITFDNKMSGTYYEFITYNNSSQIRIIGKSMRANGVVEAYSMSLKSNGDINSLFFDTQEFSKNISDMSPDTVIDSYSYNLNKPIILNYDTSKYMFINLKMPTKVAESLKYVTLFLKGTISNNLDIALNNSVVKTLKSGSSEGMYIIYL